MKLRSVALGAAVALALASPAHAQQLPRRAALGVALAPPPDGVTGVLVNQVIPGGTAAQIGVQQGDLIVAVGGRPVASPAEVGAYAAQLSAGGPVAIVVRRGAQELNLAGRAAERPREPYQGARVEYGAVPFRGGLLRDIFVAPDGVREPPVLFLIQGYTCASVEAPNPQEPYRLLGQALLSGGIAYYRVEKPSVGDSRGGVQCLTSDYATELDAFRAAYRDLVQRRGIGPERIFILGHSLGGLQAPMLAAETPPRGVAVYGTVLRNWSEYHRDVSQFQPFLAQAQDPVRAVESAAAYRDLFRRFYLGREDPRALGAENPAFAHGLREAMAWDGGENLFGRSYRFAQDLAHLPLMAAWRDTRSNVLSMYGATDFAALYDEDHRMIAEVVNHYRPGSARFVQFENTGHGMDLIGSQAEVRARVRAGGQQPEGPFNPQVATVLIEWIRQSMARPPVAAAAR